MRISRRNGKRPRYGIVGSELAGALSIASQMALLCPPGLDELVRRELAGEGRGSRWEPGRAPATDRR